MNSNGIIATPILTLICLALAPNSAAQQNSLSSTLEIYVFPSAGQTAQQQNIDEGECYTWAVDNTGTDPFDLARQVQQQQANTDAARQQADRVGEGAAVGGAVSGAAAGALIGAIAGDAGKGAAWGAGLGALGGASARREARRGARATVDRQAESQARATTQQTDNFKRAFGVCLEAKGYMVK